MLGITARAATGAVEDADGAPGSPGALLSKWRGRDSNVSERVV